LPTLAAVLRHYNEAPAAAAGHSAIKPLELAAEEHCQLEAFPRTPSVPRARLLGAETARTPPKSTVMIAALVILTLLVALVSTEQQ
jgi:hypothetical protein